MVRRAISPGQESLNFSTAVEAPPVVNLDDLQALTRVLQDRDWTTANDLAQLLGGKWTDRKVRRVASAAGAAVIGYPGSPGYKLWEMCTIEEINHCINSFKSQARDMAQRAALYEMAYHSRFRGGSAGS